MTSMLVFAEELLHEICVHLPKGSLAALAQSCKRMYRISKPILYELPNTKEGPCYERKPIWKSPRTLCGAIKDAAQRDDEGMMYELLLSNTEVILKDEKRREEALHFSCARGYRECVEFLIKDGVPPSTLFGIGWDIHTVVGHRPTAYPKDADRDIVSVAEECCSTPLLAARRNRHDEIFQMLLDAGANLARYSDDPTEMAYLLMNWRAGPNTIGKGLLERGLTLSSHPDYQEALFREVCLAGSVEDVALLLDAKQDPMPRGGRTSTPMSWALERAGSPLGRETGIDIVRLLIERGVPVDEPCKQEEYPIHVAAYFGATEAVELLLEKGAKVDQRENQGKHTALRLLSWGASSSFDREWPEPRFRDEDALRILRILLGSGLALDTDLPSTVDLIKTLLRSGMPDCLQELVQNYTDELVRLECGDLAFIAASHLGDVTLMQRILDLVPGKENKLRIVNSTRCDTTALIEACKSRKAGAARFLLEKAGFTCTFDNAHDFNRISAAESYARRWAEESHQDWQTGKILARLQRERESVFWSKR
ncbi:ankyrin repeat-containing domain protein [Aspergillus karnatakaensis]|uniref:ankyrin repeat-containing domain protein n=1 Tax=Aspergillus karnatakaensis TaxID=1810916 RepID=UPI003CCD2A27